MERFKRECMDIKWGHGIQIIAKQAAVKNRK